MKEEGTAATSFRAWKINFISFWVALGVTCINIGLSWSIRSSTVNNFLSYWGIIIASLIGAVALSIGIYFAWFLDNLWHNYDPSESLE